MPDSSYYSTTWCKVVDGVVYQKLIAALTATSQLTQNIFLLLKLASWILKSSKML